MTVEHHFAMTEAGNDLWARVSDSDCRCYILGAAFLSRRGLSNLSQVLGLGSQGELARMMRMSGVDEAYITGGASDYDKLEALCKALPLWSGHPYYAAVHAMLCRVFDIRETLSVQTLPAIWQQTARHLFDTDLTPADLPRLWGVGRSVLMLTPHEMDDLTAPIPDNCELHLLLPNLVDLWRSPLILPLSPNAPAEDMDISIDRLLSIYAEKGCRGVSVELSALDSFVRPDPYRPAQAVMRLQSKRRLDEASDGQLITAQTLRLLGSACTKRGMKLTLLHPRPDVLTPLCDYLRGCDCLPTTAVAVSCPCDVSPWGVEPLMSVSACQPPELLAHELTVFASRMPLGALGGLYMPVSEPVDLPLWAEAGRTLCQCVADFGDMGRGTQDVEEQTGFLKKILGNL